MILDGFGLNPSKKNNAVYEANTPRLDEYFGRYSHTAIDASGLAVGLTVSIFQAVSQVHEMTLTFIPKIVVIFFSLMIFGPWIIRVVLNFATGILSNLDEYARM